MILLLYLSLHKFYQDDPSTSRALSKENELFTTRAEQIIDDGFPLYLFKVQLLKQR